jgi:hypothetical protein
MGSFYTSCGLSNHQIFDDEKIVGFFLKPSERYRARAYSVYAWDLFSFASLPLVGTYNDYGSIELTKPQTELSKSLLNPNQSLDEFQTQMWRGNEGGFIYFHDEVYRKAIQTFGLARESLSDINDFIAQNRNDYDQSKTEFLAEMNLTHALSNDSKMSDLGYLFENIGGNDGIHTSIKRQFRRHIIEHLDSKKHPEIKEFKDIPNIEQMINALYEMRDLSNAMSNLNKMIMPQFTSGQDRFILEQAKWETFMLSFSNERIKQHDEDDWFEENEVQELKDFQKSFLEAQMLDFGLNSYKELEKKKSNKM